MRLVRYGRPGKEKPGLIDDEGKLRDLSGVIADIDAAQLAPKALRKLEKIAQASLPLVRGNPRYGVPVARVGKFIGIGLNYSDHAAEIGMPAPKEPVVFMKAVTCVNGPDDPVMLPQGSKKTDWEVELGVVIGTRAQYVSEADALDHVAGYCVVNDVSERAFQFEMGSQWDKGKGCDTFGPIGPAIATDLDWSAARVKVALNGRVRQDYPAADMILPPARIVSLISREMTLHPGDVIACGTSVGALPMRPGMTVAVSIDGIGTLENPYAP